MAITRKAQSEISARTRVAADLIGSLRPGDHVMVTSDGRDRVMRVSRGPSLADGSFGAWEGIRVTVTFGVGRYSREIIADSVGNGFVTVRRASTDEVTAADYLS